MAKSEAIQKAISLLRTPALIRSLRTRPLPRDVIVLIRIAAGCTGTIAEAMTTSGEPMQVLKEAAVFYLTQILLHAGADSYRTLGVSPDAPQEELRRNMAWLLRWLHPDLDQDRVLSGYSRRVIRAWEDLKTSERRAIYDKKRPVPTSRGPYLSPALHGLLHAAPQASCPSLRFEKMSDRPWHRDIRAAVLIIVLTASAAWLSIAGPFQWTVTVTDGGWLDRVLGK